MKKFVFLPIIICICISVSACKVQLPQDTRDSLSVTDSMGNTFQVPVCPSAVSAYGSFADCWLLSGGTLAGVTTDAVERGIIDEGTIPTIGTVHSINIEAIAELTPDYLLLSAESEAQLKLKPVLDSMGIRYGYFCLNSFDDYKALMQKLCDLNSRPDLYKQNVVDIEEEISRIKAKASPTDKTYILMRAMSTGIKVRTGLMAEDIINDFGLTNITDSTPSLLKDLSIEQLAVADPDYIFVLTMGDEERGMEQLSQQMEANPLWSTLSAVQNDRVYVLPKDLFHYKPNSRWAESYGYLEGVFQDSIYINN